MALRKLRIIFAIIALTILNLPIQAAVERDPTRPPDSTVMAGVGDIKNFKIDAIVITPQKRYIRIGDREFQVGDEILGAKIVAITEQQVKLKNQNDELTISIFEPINKKVN